MAPLHAALRRRGILVGTLLPRDFGVLTRAAAHFDW